MIQLQPLAGEEMSLPQLDPHRDGFVDGERTLAAQILHLIDDLDTEFDSPTDAAPLEEEMVLSLGRT